MEGRASSPVLSENSEHNSRRSYFRPYGTEVPTATAPCRPNHPSTLRSNSAGATLLAPQCAAPGTFHTVIAAGFLA